MRVKIGDTWYDSNEQPIVVQTDEQEREQIADLTADEGKYGSFPEDCPWTTEEMLKWMEG